MPLGLSFSLQGKGSVRKYRTLSAFAGENLTVFHNYYLYKAAHIFSIIIPETVFRRYRDEEKDKGNRRIGVYIYTECGVVDDQPTSA